MEIKRILWPTDLSEESKQAMPALQSLAKTHGADLVVLHVMDDVVRASRLAQAMNHDEAVRFKELLRSDADATLDEVCAVLGESCPNFEKHVVEGDPAEEILKFISAEKIDMVVMATHGAQSRKAYTSARVAQEVVGHAMVPVLTVPIT